jgi:RNA polymerase sigma-70 factor (ECF subfamily)
VTQVFISTTNTLSQLPLTNIDAVPTASAPAAMGSIARLTTLLAAGDEAAFREFHDRFFNRLYCFLLVVARGSEDEALEALQQTLLRVVRYARVFTSEEVFWSWLKALARSAARDAGRQRQRYTALLERFAHFVQGRESQDQSAGEEGTLHDLVEEVLAALPPEERRLIEGKYLLGETVRELSARVGLTEKAVEARLGRLRQHLRNCLLERLRSS